MGDESDYLDDGEGWINYGSEEDDEELICKDSKKKKSTKQNVSMQNWTTVGTKHTDE